MELRELQIQVARREHQAQAQKARRRLARRIWGALLAVVGAAMILATIPLFDHSFSQWSVLPMAIALWLVGLVCIVTGGALIERRR